MILAINIINISNTITSHCFKTKISAIALEKVIIPIDIILEKNAIGNIIDILILPKAEPIHIISSGITGIANNNPVVNIGYFDIYFWYALNLGDFFTSLKNFLLKKCVIWYIKTIPNIIPHIPITKAGIGPNWRVPVKIVDASGTGKHIGCRIQHMKNIKYLLPILVHSKYSYY